MRIEAARTLAIGATVFYPADRGEASGNGRVESIGASVYRNVSGDEYIWVTVRYTDGHAATWPSNRLGKQ